MTSDIYPVVLCGGSGTRLWPMSRRLLPKQFLRLASARTMMQETVLRLRDAAAPIMVCNDEHRFLVSEQLRDIDVTPAGLLLEPAARNPAPAVAAAALMAADRNPAAILFVLPSDHVIRDRDEFLAAAGHAVPLAAQGRLVTFGIRPNAPETGYGYIEMGSVVGRGPAREVARFVEKPDGVTAAAYFASARYLWNSGMFVFSARRFLDELHEHRADISDAVREAWTARSEDGSFIRLGKSAFAHCPADSVDCAVMERTRSAAVIETDMGWSDVGSWAALWDIGEKDPHGNVVRGDVALHDTRNSYVRAEHRLVSVSGLDEAIVVETSDSVLVTHRRNAQEVKELVARLDGAKRSEHVSHRCVYRPWGYYESIDAGSGFQVKRIMVKPGEALSLQLHHRRAEHWVVVSGVARVTCGEKSFDLHANQSTYIPIGARHRLENLREEPLFIIEIQSGEYLGEDDIVRFEDRYSRHRQED